MNPSTNPFLKGYRQLSVQRFAQVASHFPVNICHRVLSNRGSQISDEALPGLPCLFDEVFAYMGMKSTDIPSVGNLFPGKIKSVVYTVAADFFGYTEYLGVLPDKRMANTILQRLTFETGFYSRSWEISSLHLDAQSWNYLESVVELDSTCRLWFEVFSLKGCGGMGLKLYDTPWREEVDAWLVEEEMPETLAGVLKLAAEGDIRILVFDPSAPILEGLTVFEEDAN